MSSKKPPSKKPKAQKATKPSPLVLSYGEHDCTILAAKIDDKVMVLINPNLEYFTFLGDDINATFPVSDLYGATENVYLKAALAILTHYEKLQSNGGFDN